MSKVTLGYWYVRGRAQIPRLLLAYTEADWEDVQYTKPEEWFGKDKQGLGIGFPNLPYIIEGDFKMSETEAIIKYIADRSNKSDQLLGSNPQERGLIWNVAKVVGEILDKVNEICYSKTPEEGKKENHDFFKAKLELLGKFKGNKEWLTGKLTVADFVLVEASYYLEQVYPEFFKEYGFLKEERERFEGLPEIKKYYESANAVKGPFTSPQMASIKF